MDFRKNDRLVNGEEGSQKELYWTSEQSDSSFPFHITKEEIHTYNEPQIQPDIWQKKISHDSIWESPRTDDSTAGCSPSWMSSSILRMWITGSMPTQLIALSPFTLNS